MNLESYLLRHFLNKPNDLSSDAQNAQKQWIQCVPERRWDWDRETGQFPEICGQASLVLHTVAKKTLLKHEKMETPKGLSDLHMARTYLCPLC